MVVKLRLGLGLGRWMRIEESWLGFVCVRD